MVASRDKFLTSLLCACLLLAGAAASGGRVGAEDVLMMERFSAWQAAYNRSYVTAAERLRRFEVYRRNMELIEATNRLGLSYRLGETPFTDLTSEEFLATHTGRLGRGATRQLITTRAGPVSEGGGRRYRNYTGVHVPESVDWRDKGAVTPIKDQQTCGDCWAFAAVAAIESLHMIKTGKLVSLSEQELVDCASPPGSNCSTGGFADQAMEWVAKNGGLTAESDYPYESEEGSCKLERNHVVKIGGVEWVEPNNEAALEAAVARQPVAVDINAKYLQNYKSGVISLPCSCCDPEDTDHSVTVVGYGTVEHSGLKYWIVKNSWGESSGENGYFRLERGVKDKEGLCGVATNPSYPVM